MRGIVKRYGAVEVIHGVDLDIANGEFVVFVGPSGCGKTTLLRMIAGLEEISGGELRIDGARMNEVPPAIVPPNDPAAGTQLAYFGWSCASGSVTTDFVSAA